MTETIQTLLLLLAVLVAVALLAERLRTAPSILLVIAGIALALVPGLPRVELAPEFVLLVILPPLIYSAGVQMSWREFRFNLRPIALLAVGCVVFTTCAVAAAVHWAARLALGRRLSARRDRRAPGRRRAAGDREAHRPATADHGDPRRRGARQRRDRAHPLPLRGRRGSTGEFSLARAAATFALILVGEIAWGLVVGWLSLRLRQWARNPRVEITLSLMTPYLAYWIPQYCGGSGVLATVATGLYVSWNGPRRISAATRLQGIFFWDLLIYLIEGFVFLLTGLEARTLTERATASRSTRWRWRPRSPRSS